MGRPGESLARGWRRYRAWPGWVQVLVAVVVALAVVSPFLAQDPGDETDQPVAAGAAEDTRRATPVEPTGTVRTTSSSLTTSSLAPSTTTSGPLASTTTSAAPTTAPPPSTTAAPPPPPPGTEAVTVTHVSDGDTIRVRLGFGGEERVRLLGINANETGECFATQATDRLRQLVDGRTVGLEADKEDRDQYDRLLRYVWAGDRFVNEILVREGLAVAVAVEPNTLYSARLDAAQAAARSEQRGIWAPDACGGPTAHSVEITHIAYDAPGNDNENLNGEWVDITNTGGVGATIGGWVLKDESASHRYTFTAGFSLEPGGAVRVYTGCGTDTASEVYWCNQGSAVWNNSGDTAFLLDGNGTVVDSLSY